MKKLLLCCCMSLLAIQVGAEEIVGSIDGVPRYVCGKDVICEGINELITAKILHKNTKEQITGLIRKNNEKTGLIELDAKVLNGSIVPPVKQYTYNSDGKIDKIIIYEDDLLNNRIEQYTYYPTGEIKSIIKYKNDILDGKYETYYKDGRKNIVGVYSQGKKDGIFITNSEDGKTRIEETFYRGKREGKYYKTSQIAPEAMKYQSSFYKNGKEEGIRTIGISLALDPGYLISETPYKNGLKDGIEKIYDNGKIHQISYQNGEIVSENWYDENGNVIQQ